MSVDPTPDEVAGVLDQLYRVGANSLPRRFHMRSESLQIFAERERSLRPEFFDQVAWELERRYSILMSYPRLGRGGTLGFASIVIAKRWPAVSEGDLQRTLSVKLGSDWAQSLRSRLRQLYELKHGDSTLSPIAIPEKQLCQLADVANFRESWWSELLEQFSKAKDEDRLVFFHQRERGNRFFVVTREDFINKWYSPTHDDWDAAQNRYNLNESN
jgi:hypothetical protein